MLSTSTTTRCSRWGAGKLCSQRRRFVLEAFETTETGDAATRDLEEYINDCEATFAWAPAPAVVPASRHIAGMSSDGAHLAGVAPAPAVSSVQRHATSQACIDDADDVISALSDRVDSGSAEQHSGAADDLLVQLFSACDGFAVRSREDVLRLMLVPMQIR